MYDATNDSIASASCSGVLEGFMTAKSHAARPTSTPQVNGYKLHVHLHERLLHALNV